MKILFRLLALLFIFISCKSKSPVADKSHPDFVLAFGSCNDQEKPQPLWSAILANDPQVFIWGGDNVYADTDDANKMRADYEMQKNNAGYQKLLRNTEVLGTWDDHDYGKNDAGREWEFKEESQQIFLDFFDVPEDSPRRDREGVYHSRLFKTPKGSIKVILLDARYFRSPLKRSNNPDRKYARSEGTILGEAQWEWLENELTQSEADFNILVSGIQMLSMDHGYESWGNFPSEIKKLQDLIVASNANNVILLSGDRHISEFSAVNIDGLDYPLMDFTSSGLTHSWEEFSGEPNSNRVGRVVIQKSFGLLKFDMGNKRVLLEMRGINNELQQDHMLDFQ